LLGHPPGRAGEETIGEPPPEIATVIAVVVGSGRAAGIRRVVLFLCWGVALRIRHTDDFGTAAAVSRERAHWRNISSLRRSTLPGL